MFWREFLSKKNYDLSKNDKDEDCVCVELYSGDTRGWYDDEDDDDEPRNTISESHSAQIVTGETVNKLEEEMWDWNPVMFWYPWLLREN